MKSFLHISRYVFSFYLKYKKGFFFYLFLLILTALTSNIEPILYKFFIDNVTNTAFKDFTYLFNIVCAVALLRLVSGVLFEIMFYVYDKGFFLKSQFDIQTAVFSHLQDLSFNFHQNKKSGTLISGMSRGQSAFFSYSFNMIFNLIFFLVDLIFLICTLGLINIHLMYIILATLVVYIFFSYFLIKENIKRRNIVNRAEDNVKAIIADNLISYETVKYYRQEEFERDRLRLEKKNWVEKNFEYAQTFRMFGIMYSVVTALSIFFTLYVSLRDLKLGLITIGSFVLIITFITRLYQKLLDIFFQFREVAKNFADLEEYVGFLELPIEIKDPVNPVKIKELNGEMRFDHVTFAYKGRRPVLSDVSFIAHCNETIALVGKSGAGKTTISKLLLRLYDVIDGKILIDGVNIQDIAQKDLKEIIGIVPQEPTLFNHTIMYNLRYARPEVSEHIVKMACKAAYLDDFIESLPLGYATEVGERGIKLSGGQKQRLAIARTIIQNPQIIIFDEATSHLDSESEHYIQSALTEIAKNKTVIIIAHRLSTIMHADKILVFEKGRIIDEGTHAKLLENGSPLYQKLWTLQSKGEIS